MKNSSGSSFVPCGMTDERTNGQTDRHYETSGLFLLVLRTRLEIYRQFSQHEWHSFIVFKIINHLNCA